MFKLQKPSNEIENDIFANMLTEYIQELNCIDTRVLKRTKQQLRQEYFNETNKLNLFLVNKTIVGFGIVYRNVNGLDVYIEEFYIRPQYRCQGYAKIFMNLLLYGANTVGFFVITTNTVAKTVWSNVFRDWRTIQSKGTFQECSSWIEWFVYSRNSEVS